MRLKSEPRSWPDNGGCLVECARAKRSAAGGSWNWMLSHVMAMRANYIVTV